MLIGMLFWLFNAVLYNSLEYLTGLLISPVPTFGSESAQLSPLQIIMFLLGMVALAPVCEEIFFRGFMQRAYEDYGIRQSWIITGVLFGAMHILNGMNNLIPAMLLGFALGFLASVTDSIWPAIALHSGTNLMSQVGSALLPAIITPQILPLWVYGLAILSALMGLVLLLAVGRRPTREPQKTTPELNGSNNIRPLLRSKPLWLAALFLLVMAGVEVELRAKQADSLIVKLSEAFASGSIGQTQETNIRAGEFTGGLLLFSIDVQSDEVGKELIFRFDLKVDEISEGTFTLLDPTGTIVWKRAYWGNQLTVQSQNQQVMLDQSGQWQLHLQGSGRNLEIRTVWQIK